MAGKVLPTLELVLRDWLDDPALAKCSLATRGVWIDLLCYMSLGDRSGVISGSLKSLSAMARCSIEEMKAALSELASTQTADVTASGDTVEVGCRRMKREHKQRLKERLKKSRQRNKKCGDMVGDMVGDIARDKAELSFVPLPEIDAKTLENKELTNSMYEMSQEGDREGDKAGDKAGDKNGDICISIKYIREEGVADSDDEFKLESTPVDDKKKEPPPPPKYTEEFERFWRAYPSYRKQGKGSAYKSWNRAIKDADPEDIIAACIAYAASPTGRSKWVRLPTTWLNQNCWEDDPGSWARGDDPPPRPTRDPSDPRGTIATLNAYLAAKEAFDG